MVRASRLPRFALAAILLAACGGSSTPAPAPAPAAPATTAGGEHHGEHGHGHAGGGGGHHHFPAGPVTAFHDVLAPLWHSEAGAARDARTCEQAATLRERAAAVVAAPPPEEAHGHEDAWRTAAAGLAREADALGAECSGTARAAVGERLAAVHTAFHELVEHLGEHH